MLRSRPFSKLQGLLLRTVWHRNDNQYVAHYWKSHYIHFCSWRNICSSFPCPSYLASFAGHPFKTLTSLTQFLKPFFTHVRSIYSNNISPLLFITLSYQLPKFHSIILVLEIFKIFFWKQMIGIATLVDFKPFLDAYVLHRCPLSCN